MGQPDWFYGDIQSFDGNLNPVTFSFTFGLGKRNPPELHRGT